MAKNANDLLQGILTTLTKIEKKMDQKSQKSDSGSGGGSPRSNLKDSLTIFAGLKAFASVKEETRKSFLSFIKDMSKIVEKDKGKNLISFSDGLSKISTALPELAKALKELAQIQEKRMDRVLSNLRRLYDLMYEMGDGRRNKKVLNAINTFDKMGKSLKNLAKPLKDIALSFAYFGIGILVFAGTLMLTAAILKLGSPTDVLLFLGITIIALVVLFTTMYLAKKLIGGGIDVLSSIGTAMTTLALGIIAFAYTISMIPVILKNESGGSIAKSLVIMVGIVLAMTAMFAILSMAGKMTKKGLISVMFMSIGIAVLSLAIMALAYTAKMLATGFTPAKGTKEEKDENKRAVIGGLGMIGLVILSAVALFAFLGIPAVAALVATGSVVAILMGISLMVMSKSIQKLVKVAQEMKGVDIAQSLSGLIGGTLQGFLDGLAPMTGKASDPVSKLFNFIKNSYKIFAGVAVLMSMSVALSMFAKAISAFAELSNMRVIEGTDKDGKPIFGEKVNLTNVANTITYSISTFLRALIDSTDGLTKQQAKAIKKMGRALTGKNGIISAVIQFAEAMKIYAQFGEKNEIGYVEFDKDGKEIHKKVKATVVVDNIIGSFLYFTDKLFNRSDAEFGDGEPDEAGISGRQKRRMKRMAKALVGKHGILGAIVQFSEVLKTFAEFGENNEIPILNDKGEPTGKKLKIGDIADNIVGALTTFSSTLSTKLENGDVKSATKALSKYEDLIENLNELSSAMDGLTKMSAAVSNLAEGIGQLGVNVDKLNADKLTKILDKTAASGNKIVYVNQTETVERRRQESTSRDTGSTESTFSSEQPPQRSSFRQQQTSGKEPDWNEISQRIGEAVGAKVAASLKAGHFVFEFDTTKSGGVYYWNPR